MATLGSQSRVLAASLERGSPGSHAPPQALMPLQHRGQVPVAIGHYTLPMCFL